MKNAIKQTILHTKTIITIIYDSIHDTLEHDGIEFAGYLAFLMLLTLFPSLIFLTSLVSSVNNLFQENTNVQTILSHILDEIPESIILALKPRITEILSGPPQNFMNIAILGALWTSSSAIEGVRTILNRAYRVHYPPPYILRRLMSIIQFIAITSSLILLIIAVNWIPYIIKILDLYVNIPNFIILFITNISYYSINILLFASVCWLYIALPNKKQNFRYIYIGALLVISMWHISVTIFSQYLKRFEQLNLVYGSLASIISSIIFFYIINLCLIIGAEINYNIYLQYHQKHKQTTKYY